MFVAAVGFALLLGSAAVGKLRDLGAFAAVIVDYRLVPRALLRPVEYAVPAVELALALAWLATPWREGAIWFAGVGTAGLMAGYGLAITANLLRGRTWIDCGCGGGDQLSWGLVARNGVLALLAVASLGLGNGESPGWTGAAVAVPVLAVCVALYLAIGALLDNGATMRAWREA